MQSYQETGRILLNFVCHDGCEHSLGHQFTFSRGQAQSQYEPMPCHLEEEWYWHQDDIRTSLHCCYDPARLCPGGIGPSFLERSGLVQVVRDPRSAHLFVRPTFHAVYVTCVKAWHTSFFYILVLVITSLLYVQFHPTLSFYF